MTSKQLYIIAGANGVGKTTFASQFIPHKKIPFLNADEIAKELENKGEQNAMIKAGRIFFSTLNKYLNEGISFAVESTISGSYLNKVAEKVRKEGYEIYVIYIFLDSPETCIERVKGRVLRGGHHVPEDDIERRFYRSLKNFWDFFKNISNGWRLFYNGIEGFEEVASGKFEHFEIKIESRFDFFFEIQKPKS